MKHADLAIATISWARNKEEEAQLQASLAQLAKHSLPVFITDGGSSEAFLRFLHSLPQFSVFSAKGLWPQVKRSLTAAMDSGAKNIFYTEPDKEDFFADHLPVLLKEKRLTATEGVALVSRSAKAYSTFPAFQQMTETAINNCCRELTGKELDYCYGPFFFSNKLLEHINMLPENCGWGWRPFLFAMAHRLNLSLEAVMGDFACPFDQREDDAGERIYRMKQLAQNTEGLVLAATAKLS